LKTLFLLIVCSFLAGVAISYVPFYRQLKFRLLADFFKGAVVALAALFLVGTPMALVTAGCGLLCATRWFPYPREHERKIYGLAAGLLLFMAPALFLLLLLWCLALGLLRHSFTEQLLASFYLMLPLLLFFTGKSDVYILFSIVLFSIVLLDNFEQLETGLQQILNTGLEKPGVTATPGGKTSPETGTGANTTYGAIRTVKATPGGEIAGSSRKRTGCAGEHTSLDPAPCNKTGAMFLAGINFLASKIRAKYCLVKKSRNRAGRCQTSCPGTAPANCSGNSSGNTPLFFRQRLRRLAYVLAAFLLVFTFFLNRYVYRGFGMQVELFRKGAADARVVALTFDDGPDPRFTPDILKTLAAEDVKATFFMVGKHAEKYPQLARQIAAAGHEIGNHTYNHVNLLQIPTERMVMEIERGEEAVFNATRQRPSLFRPPRGLYDANLLKETKDRGYTVILWSLSSRDWLEMRPQDISQTILQKVSPGEIILFHDSGNLIRAEGGDRLPTVRSLQTIIRGLKKEGYDFVTITELLILSGLSGDL
jgi:peptidoglycan/xylan/chitin deacetylase (PgdA/CDA1 family)